MDLLPGAVYLPRGANLQHLPAQGRKKASCMKSAPKEMDPEEAQRAKRPVHSFQSVFIKIKSIMSLLVFLEPVREQQELNHPIKAQHIGGTVGCEPEAGISF